MKYFKIKDTELLDREIRLYRLLDDGDWEYLSRDHRWLGSNPWSRTSVKTLLEQLTEDEIILCSL